MSVMKLDLRMRFRRKFFFTSFNKNYFTTTWSSISIKKSLCSSATAFVSLRPIQNSTITLPNHIQIPTSFYGDVTLSSMLTLKDVLFVPQFKYNLISMSALTYGLQFPISFILDCFIIQELNTKKMISRGEKFEDLYILDTNTLKSAFIVFVNNVLAHVWHNRLGHLSFKRLDALKNIYIVLFHD